MIKSVIKIGIEVGKFKKNPITAITINTKIITLAIK